MRSCWQCKSRPSGHVGSASKSRPSDRVSDAKADSRFDGGASESHLIVETVYQVMLSAQQKASELLKLFITECQRRNGNRKRSCNTVQQRRL
jgi:hypothetical protein